MEKLCNYLLLLPLLAPLNVFSTTTVWNGELINTSYVNENIVVTGDTNLALDTTTVSAQNEDIVIHIQEKAHVNSSNYGPSTLILEVAYPWTITIYVEKSLQFGGTENNLALPLIILEKGNGTVRWVVEDNASLTFGSSDTRGGTLLTINFDGLTLPKNIFEAQGNGNIIFKRHSKMGYRIAAPGTITEYAIVDAVNPTKNHTTLITYDDGATILGYERRLVLP